MLSRLERDLRMEAEKFGAKVLRIGTHYPPQVKGKPVFRKRKRTTAPDRRKGSRYVSSGYKRTGTLRRSWHFDIATRGTAIVATVASASSVAPYNVVVQGPKDAQSERMRSRGWKSVPEEATKLWPKTEKAVERIFERLTK